MPPLLSKKATQSRIQHAQPYLQGRVLDLGCGFSFVPEALTAGQAYTGVDGLERALVWDRQRYPQHTFHLRDLDREPLGLDEARFDTIIMLAVLEHLHRPEPLLLQVRQVLDAGGRLVLTTPTPFGDIAHRIGGRINLFYTEQIVAHVKIFRRKELFRLAEAAGFSVHHYQRFLYQTNHLLVCQAAD
jgi:2-polyprenyl-3-methyl-5-hydroxy-6-metoxy-1,4-benzoquinol methylase